MQTDTLHLYKCLDVHSAQQHHEGPNTTATQVRINNIRGFSTSSEFTEGMVGVASCLLQLKEPPGIIHQVLFMLRVHSVHLPVLTALIKQRAQEELSKPTDSRRGQASHSAFIKESPASSESC